VPIVKTLKNNKQTAMTQADKKEEYIVTARKWRPLRFSDIIGQEHVSKTLKNAISSGRIHHALLFSGPRGVGKTTTARIFARAVNCTAPEDFEPCNKCESCTTVLDNRSMDVIEIDGASNNSVDDIRKLRESAKYPPTSGKFKIYIIDEVHMLSTSAFNALLKTLEEPPPHLLFIFATTESHKLPATILSRCQRFDFRSMTIDDIVGQLKFIAGREEITVDEESLIAISKKADGSMRDGQSIFDQVVAFCGTDIDYKSMANALRLIDRDFFFRISDAVKDKDVGEMYSVARDVMTRGYDMKTCLGGLLEHFRNMMTVKVAAGIDYIESSDSYRERYRAEACFFSKTDLLRYMNLTAKTQYELRFAPQPRLRFELALVQLASMDNAVDIGELINEIKELKKNGGLDSALTSEQPQAAGAVSVPTPPKVPVQSTTIPKPAPTVVVSEVKEEYTAEPVKDTFNSAGAGGLEENWPGFIKKYAKSEYDLSLLSIRGMTDVRFFDEEIMIYIEDSFTFNVIDKNKVAMQKYAFDFFGRKLEVKIIQSKYGAEEKAISNTGGDNIIISENKENSVESSGAEKETAETEIKQYPVEEAIKDYFKAVKI
jgi:DNA polymerase-3 subunit gamma/tau